MNGAAAPIIIPGISNLSNLDRAKQYPNCTLNYTFLKSATKLFSLCRAGEEYRASRARIFIHAWASSATTQVGIV